MLFIVANVNLAHTLPQVFQDYLAQQQAEITDMSYYAFLILFISYVGMWKFKSWARVLFAILTIGFIPFSPIMGPIVMNGWESMFSSLMLTTGGALLVMTFTGKAGEKFKSTKDLIQK